MNTPLRVALLRPTPPESPDLAPETIALAEGLAAMGHRVHLFSVDHRGKSLRVCIRGPLTLHTIAPVSTGVTRHRATLHVCLSMLREAARLECVGRLDLTDIPALAPDADPFALILPIVAPTLVTLRTEHDRERAGQRAQAYGRALDRAEAGMPARSVRESWRGLAAELARLAPPAQHDALHAAASPSASTSRAAGATPELV
jgi:hypothetical protein